MTQSVPLVDLQWQHAEIADEVTAGFADVIGAGSFVGGQQVTAFEREYAATMGVPHCVGVANGTDALELALRAVGVGPGHEVVLPAMTFVATAEAVVRCGATPVLVDVDPDHLLLDPRLLTRALSERTRAVLPVHLYGQLAPMERILEITMPRGIPVVEDAAQCQGATRHGRPAGTFGDAAGTSFYPGKNLGAYGDAGAVLTGATQVATRVRLLANHGAETKYDHITVGFNSRMDALQAVVLRAKLAHLARWNTLRQEAASRYDKLLDGVDRITLPRTATGNTHVWHLYPVRVDDRDAVLSRLQHDGIGAGVHYPRPVHLHPAFAALGAGVSAFPVAEQAAGTLLSLPLHPGISADQQERVAEALVRAIR
ncbi:DegT/DnrJ/EryC1/StrS family aminotransferase [Micromonospora sp. NPDC047548]|uniref:DegT/DnrJ/EryC1/StrS family aminotransferase n=1 Tax=Micromonospora sp. NPDC047548 TaxID=3155624 RepID=UPI0033DA5A3D